MGKQSEWKQAPPQCLADLALKLQAVGENFKALFFGSIVVVDDETDRSYLLRVSDGVSPTLAI